MAITASAAPPRDPSQLVPPGAHIAVCIRVVDVGVQPGGKFEPRRQVYLGWELPDLPHRKYKDSNGDEHMGRQGIGGFYTLSLDPKAKLRQLLEAWRGRQFTDEECKGFNISVVLGRTCMLNVVHNTSSNGQVYANVGVVMAPPAGTPPRKAEGTTIEYSLATPNEQVFAQLPKFLRNRIAQRILPPANGAKPPAQASQPDPWSAPLPQQESQAVTAPQTATTDEFDEDIPF